MEKIELIALFLMIAIMIIEILAFNKWRAIRLFSLVRIGRTIAVIYIVHLLSFAVLLAVSMPLLFDISGIRDVGHITSIFIFDCIIFLISMYVFLQKVHEEEIKRKKQFKLA